MKFAPLRFPQLIMRGTMWSSCGFNMALFRNTSVLWYPRSWTVTGFFFPSSLPFGQEGALQIPRPSEHCCSPLTESLLLYYNSHAYMATGWELGKILHSGKWPLICTGKSRFFVNYETLHTGK